MSPNGIDCVVAHTRLPLRGEDGVDVEYGRMKMGEIKYGRVRPCRIDFGEAIVRSSRHDAVDGRAGHIGKPH